MSGNGSNGGKVRNGINGNVSATPTPYLLAALLGASTSGELGPDEVQDVTVLHDEDCPLLKGLGPCECEPILEFRRLKVEGVR